MKVNMRKSLVLSVLLAAILVSACGQPQPLCCDTCERQCTSGGPMAQPIPTPNANMPDLGEDATVIAMAFGVPGEGNVIALGLMDTMRYVIQVSQGAQGTFIMASLNGEYLLAWSMQGNTWGFLALSQNGVPITDITKLANGNVANTMTFTDLVKHLENNNWNYVYPSALPTWLSSVIGSAQAFMIEYGSVLASPLPIFIVIPGGDIETLDPAYLGNG